ncbi:MAG TPA: Si-specific NAD(P)(+) transhydrogenase [Blastocatellia bacterium]|nr:Si-specific NAD(P)(+) transhydrogenase [Blastocatellia bacterium]
MEKITTESTPFAEDTGGPPPAAQQRGREEQAVRSKCPDCGFDTYQSHRFCRRCGINLDPWQYSTTVLPNEDAAVTNDNPECLVRDQKLTTTRLVTGRNMNIGEHRFDLVIIGSGPAGQKGAIAAAKLGKRVAIVDRRERIGGMSLHTGTIPSKTLREAVLYLTGYRQRAFYGRDYKLKAEISVADLSERVKTVVDREMIVIREQLGRNGVTVLDGTARFTGPHTLEIEGDQGPHLVEADYVLIACGTRPAHAPDIPYGDRVRDVDQIWQVNNIPRDLIVVGAGVIGLEYASMLTALGIRVTIIDQRPNMLDFVDQEIVEALSYHLRRREAIFRLGEKVTKVEVNERGQVQVRLESGKRLRAEGLLYAAGRQVNTDLLNLPAAGLEPDGRGRLAVNEHYQSAVSHIYAAGDCIGFPSLAATSMEQGRLAAHHMFGRPAADRPSLLPYGIYTIPEISMVGRTEQELTGAGIPYESGVARYDEVAKGQIIGDETGMLKILFHPDTLKVLGVHAIGENATEIIHIGQTLLALDGTVEFLRDSVFNYPTFAEAYKVAALNGLNKL